VLQLVEVFRARVVDVQDKALVVEVTGSEDKIEQAISVLRPFGVIEMVRTGIVAMARGAEAVSPNPPLVAAEVAEEAALPAGVAMSV
jgi:acetolactate synthase-1/3 small subunit